MKRDEHSTLSAVVRPQAFRTIATGQPIFSLPTSQSPPHANRSDPVSNPSPCRFAQSSVGCASHKWLFYPRKASSSPPGYARAAATTDSRCDRRAEQRFPQVGPAGAFFPSSQVRRKEFAEKCAQPNQLRAFSRLQRARRGSTVAPGPNLSARCSS